MELKIFYRLTSIVFIFFLIEVEAQSKERLLESTHKFKNSMPESALKGDVPSFMKNGINTLPSHDTLLRKKGKRFPVISCNDPAQWTLLNLGETVKFRSPRFPNNYPHNSSCGWNIGSFDTNVRIKITCGDNFRLQGAQKKNCLDFLYINNNYYCGRVFPRKWISKVNYANVWFLSDGSKNFKGFKCRAKAIDVSTINPFECSANPLINYLPIGNLINIKSPFYHKKRKYPKNTLCGWYFQGADWSTRVNVSCDNFELQDPRNNGKCRDYLEVSPDEYCGVDGPNGYIDDTSQTSIWFSSNFKVEKKGFRCSVTGVGPDSYGVGSTSGCKCGRVNRDSRIIGGQNATINEYPWQVALVEVNGTDILCGGSIINDRWILTAAHCTPSWSTFQVIVGGHDLDVPGSAHVRYNVETVVNHPLYDQDTANNDLSLVKLDAAIDFSDPSVAPICPPDLYKTYYNVNATATGWGVLEYDTEDFPDVLQEVDVTTITNYNCSVAYDSLYDITDYMICAGHPDGGRDACQGDSGGPLVVQEEGEDYYSLVGVSSFGEGCGEQDYPGVYATVANQMAWITSVASDGETCPKY